MLPVARYAGPRFGNILPGPTLSATLGSLAHSFYDLNRG
jgi:hypothetical protein